MAAPEPHVAPAASSIITAVGNTPVIRCERLCAATKTQAKICLKLEYTNPGGSVKDRVAVSMLQRAEEEGKIRKGSKIVESSSGNTAVGLATACSVMGYEFHPVIDKLAGERKRKTMRLLGAKLHVVGEDLVDPSPNDLKALRRQTVKDLVKEFTEAGEHVFVPDQYNNPANPYSHVIGTGPEYLKQLPELGAICLSVSTGGQLGGLARYLKEQKPSLVVIGAEPTGSQIFGGEKSIYFSSGTGLDYTPVHATNAEDCIDAKLKIDDDDSFAAAAALSRYEGVISGVSTGMALFASLLAAHYLPPGTTIGLLACDSLKDYDSGFDIVSSFTSETIGADVAARVEAKLAGCQGMFEKKDEKGHAVVVGGQ